VGGGVPHTCVTCSRPCTTVYTHDMAHAKYTKAGQDQGEGPTGRSWPAKSRLFCV
jgi:hypothetical protein